MIPPGTTFKFEFLGEFEVEIKNILEHESVAPMGLIHEKNQRPKISCYCTFKQVPDSGPISKHGNRGHSVGQRGRRGHQGESGIDKSSPEGVGCGLRYIRGQWPYQSSTTPPQQGQQWGTWTRIGRWDPVRLPQDGRPSARRPPPAARLHAGHHRVAQDKGSRRRIVNSHARHDECPGK